jgi:hypothetical protein
MSEQIELMIRINPYNGSYKAAYTEDAHCKFDVGNDI